MYSPELRIALPVVPVFNPAALTDWIEKYKTDELAAQTTEGMFKPVVLTKPVPQTSADDGMFGEVVTFPFVPL